MNATTARRALALSRMAVGVASWATPRASARAFGIDPERSSGVITRLFGARDLALGATLLLADDARLAQAAGIGAAIDAVDAVGTALEFRGGDVSPYAAVSVGGGAALFCMLGLTVLRGARSV